MASNTIQDGKSRVQNDFENLLFFTLAKAAAATKEHEQESASEPEEKVFGSKTVEKNLDECWKNDCRGFPGERGFVQATVLNQVGISRNKSSS